MADTDPNDPDKDGPDDEARAKRRFAFLGLAFARFAALRDHVLPLMGRSLGFLQALPRPKLSLAKIPLPRADLPWNKVAAIVTSLIVIALCLALLFARNPLGGEPIATASIDTANVRTTMPTQPEITEQRLNGGARPNGTAAPSEQETTDNSRASLASRGDNVTGLDPRVSEKSKFGMLPTIAKDGTRPLDAYGVGFRPKTTAEAVKPRIGIIISGLGISQAGTNEAINRMPAAVSLAFAPYGPGLDAVVQRARASQHEVYLQLPMEPFDYPDNDSGPQSMLTSFTADRNIERLEWSLGRFSGYAGVMNYMGAKFTASDQALSPIMREISRRGLLYVDDGSSARSVADHAANMAKTPFLKADLSLDRIQTPSELDAQLAKLELMAKEKGSAIGIGSAFPVTLERVQNWARGLEKKGFVLVPLSGLIARREPS